jgi:xanthine dehydrogenase accessory factor
MERIFAQLLYAAEKKLDTVLVTIIRGDGSSPRGVGAQMLVGRDGRIVGTIGGGAVEGRSEAAAKDALKQGTSFLRAFSLTEAAENSIGMACGGTVQVLIETIAPRQKLYIFGGGHIGSALTRYASDVGFDVTVIDDRPDFASKDAHPAASAVQCCTYEEAVKLDFASQAFFVIVTHQHIGDSACLEGLLKRPELNPKYIGLIGSAKKLSRAFHQMIENGYSRQALEAVHAPIGIDHGGQNANEIALAIATEIVAVKYGKTLNDAMSAKKHPLFLEA